MIATDKQIDYVLRTVEERDIRFIRLWFTDVLGFLKSFAITPAELEGAFAEGMGFDGSAIEGFARVQESDMLARPDPATFQILPAMAGQGRPEPLDQGSYFDLTPLDSAQDFRRQAIQTLEAMGISVEYSHHEVAPSQHEIDLRFADALSMADNVMTYRLVVKEVAQERGMHATFMPKPIQGQWGSGMHTHVSLFEGDRNAFFDPNEPAHMSKVGRGFVAGLLRHAREITPVLNQWVNSYKRLVPGYEAPA